MTRTRPRVVRYPSTIVQLKDGREIDITGMEAAAAIDTLRAAGVHSADEIANTWHFLAARPQEAG